MQRSGRLLEIHCGARTCAVIGDLPPAGRHGESDQAMRALQLIDLVKAMMDQGYGNDGSSFGPSAADNRRMFLTFYRRLPR